MSEKRWLTVSDVAQALFAANKGVNKEKFAQLLREHFGLQKARSVSYADDFAVRFAYAGGPSFSNCVVSRLFENVPL